MRRIHASYPAPGEFKQSDRLLELLAMALATHLKKPARAGLIRIAQRCSMSDMNTATNFTEITYSDKEGPA